jgi:hypothetical protein
VDTPRNSPAEEREATVRLFFTALNLNMRDFVGNEEKFRLFYAHVYLNARAHECVVFLHGSKGDHLAERERIAKTEPFEKVKPLLKKQVSFIKYWNTWTQIREHIPAMEKKAQEEQAQKPIDHLELLRAARSMEELFARGDITNPHMSHDTKKIEPRTMQQAHLQETQEVSCEDLLKSQSSETKVPGEDAEFMDIAELRKRKELH